MYDMYSHLWSALCYAFFFGHLLGKIVPYLAHVVHACACVCTHTILHVLLLSLSLS